MTIPPDRYSGSAREALSDTVLQQHDRPTAIDDQRAAAAKPIQRLGVENVDTCCGHSAAEFGYR
jgi:hypothetical protein